MSQWRGIFDLFITASPFPSFLPQSSVFKIPQLLVGAVEADGPRVLGAEERLVDSDVRFLPLVCLSESWTAAFSMHSLGSCSQCLCGTHGSQQLCPSVWQGRTNLPVCCGMVVPGECWFGHSLPAGSAPCAQPCSVSEETLTFHSVCLQGELEILKLGLL